MTKLAISHFFREYRSGASAFFVFIFYFETFVTVMYIHTVAIDENRTRARWTSIVYLQFFSTKFYYIPSFYFFLSSLDNRRKSIVIFSLVSWQICIIQFFLSFSSWPIFPMDLFDDEFYKGEINNRTSFLLLFVRIIRPQFDQIKSGGRLAILKHTSYFPARFLIFLDLIRLTVQ